MQLTAYSDYTIRVLLFLGENSDRLVSTEEISEFYNISKNHLLKVVNNLGHLGIIEIRRGRSGGLKLAKKPKQINIGELIKKTEPNFNIVECFDPENNQCNITSSCKLKGILNSAKKSFLKELNKSTLADLL